MVRGLGVSFGDILGYSGLFRGIQGHSGIFGNKIYALFGHIFWIGFPERSKRRTEPKT